MSSEDGSKRISKSHISGYSRFKRKLRFKSLNTQKFLINTIAELNNNLKQNTTILSEMKESLSNLSLYRDESRVDHNDMDIIEELKEQSFISTEHLHDKHFTKSSDTIGTVRNASKYDLNRHDSDDICNRPEMVSLF